MNNKDNKIIETESEEKKTKTNKSSAAGTISIICLVLCPFPILILYGIELFISPSTSPSSWCVSFSNQDVLNILGSLFFIGLGGILLLTAFISFIVFLFQKCGNKQNQQQLSSEENVPEKQENE